MIRNSISFLSLLTMTTIVVFTIGCNIETDMVVKTGIGASEDSPKLIIGITIDQMRADYLHRYSPYFSEGPWQPVKIACFVLLPVCFPPEGP